MTIDRRDATEVVEDVIAAHGWDAWTVADAVTLSFDATGLAFAVRGQRSALVGATAVVRTSGQHVAITGSSPTVWRFAASGAAELRDAEARLRSGRPRLYWTPEDLGAFAAVAMWTYVHTQFHLVSPDVHVADIGRSRDGLRRLLVRFPDSIVTHSSTQTLHLDERGLIRRHDYTAQAFGRWARASQVVGAYVRVDGLVIATRRIVTPRLPRGHRAPFPVLVDVSIHDVVLS